MNKNDKICLLLETFIKLSSETDKTYLFGSAFDIKFQIFKIHIDDYRLAKIEYIKLNNPFFFIFQLQNGT